MLEATSSLATIVVGLCVFGVVALAVRKLVRDKKNHKCSCGCSHCPHAAHGGGCRQDAARTLVEPRREG